MSKRRERRLKQKEKQSSNNILKNDMNTPASNDSNTINSNKKNSSNTTQTSKLHTPDFDYGNSLLGKIKKFYTEQYKLLAIIPIVLLVLAFVQIGVQIHNTGDFVSKGVSISGGVTVTILNDMEFDIKDINQQLKTLYPSKDIGIKRISEGTKDIGILLEANIFEKEEIDVFLSNLEQILGLDRELFNAEITGPSLGDSFFKSILKALLLAFLFMGIVVFLYFRNVIPSLAVMLAAFSDMVMTLAVINLLGMKISTAGVVAFLLLIGYSVDTDILLTIRTLKRKEGHYMDRIFDSIKTGLTMNVTTLAAVGISLLFTSSEVIAQIMTILLIGLLADIINTWIQNVAILRLYLEWQEKKKNQTTIN